MGTIQLDFQLPARFGCKYIDSDGKAKVPVVIHRAIYGSLDRFIAILLEHTAGILPVWLAPLKAIIVPIADRHHEYAERVRSYLGDRGIKCEVDKASHRMNRRIRDAELRKVPYIIIVGDNESESDTVSVRFRGGEKENDLDLSGFAEMVSELILNKSTSLR
ncbi:MAG: threonine--tRNA ligase, partial [Cyanobacteria bacterium]|nr:threonine--tRNA ligase [Cyanobacteriota bacterium]